MEFVKLNATVGGHFIADWVEGSRNYAKSGLVRCFGTPF